MSPPAATADTPQTNPQSSPSLLNSKQNSTHNPHLVAARTAVLALIHAGVSPNDPRVETLLTLISKASSSQTFQKQNLQQHSSPSNFIKPSILPHNQPTFSNLIKQPPGLQLPTSNPSLQHTQCAIVTARAATHPNIIPSHSSRHSNQPPSVFRTARTLTADIPSSSNRKPKKDVKTSPNGRLILSPHTRQSTSDSELDIQSTIPFSSQLCGEISAEHTFQIKAQIETYRRLLKGMPIPPIMLTASNGAPSSQPPIKPQHGPLVVRGAPDDLPSTQISTQAYLIPQEKQHFDPRLLPRFDDDHEFTKQDVILPHEKYAKIQVDEQEINRRILLAETHHKRISKFRMHEGSVSSEEENYQTNNETSFDPALKQQFAQLLNTNVITKNEDEQISLPEPIYAKTKQNHREKKSPRRRERSLPTIPDSALRLQAAAPIAVETKLTNAPNPHDLKMERDRRITMRVQSRIQEINELLKTAQGELRQTLLKEQKAIRLIGLQRSVRSRLMKCMHKTLDRSGISDIRKEKITRMRRPPIIYTYADPRLQHVPMAAPRNAMAYRQEQQLRRHHRHANKMKQLLRHKDQLQSFFNSHFTLRKKLMKDLERYFRDKSREEERRKKKEQMDRLRALRNNNEDEYLELLKTTKNKRLIQLLKQTDEYLVQIGAQVERQKQTARESGEFNEFKESQPNSSNVNYENGKESYQEKKDGSGEDDELNQLKKRRNDYYTITHTISERVYQPHRLIGGKLKHYQLEGLEWLVSLYNNNLNGILADEMGLGKTIQTISLIAYLVEVKKMHGPFLVIVPLSVMSNWVRELDKWAPSLTKVTYKGDPITRRNIKFTEMDDKQYNVLLTTYEFITKDKHVLGRIRWKYIIMDEGHRLKNAECKLALTLGSKYTSRNRLLLTGTPLQNNMTELWALLNFLLPSIFSSAETFETWFNAPFQASALGGSAELNEEENLLIISRLHQVLRPFMLRRLKTDVETQLPDKVEIVFRCEMSIWQRVLYRQMRGRLGIAAGAGNVGTRSFNNMVMQLKKVCNHPFLFYNEEELMSIPREFLMRAAGKFELLDHVLKKLKRAGHRVLIFSQMTAALDYLEYFLNTIGMKNLRLDGTTKADDRQEMLELFNADNSDYFCFLLSTRAGGLGLNLQTADTVIIFDSDWNPMMDLQAQDRAHRIGQTKEVRVFRLICSGSIEVKILERANKKLQIDAQVIQAGQFNNKSSDNDRQEMLKDLLRQQTGDEKDAMQDVSARTDINRQLARSEDEFKLFEEMDNELAKEAGGKPRLVVDENELPKWVMKPEKSEKDKIVSEAEFLMEHGRGRRKRKEVVYNDNLTEREWALAMEEDGDIAEAVKRKKRKLSTGPNDSDIEADEADEADEIEQQITDQVDTPSQEHEVVEQEESGGTNVEDKTKEENSSDKADGGESGSNSKLEPFVDPDLHREPRAKRKRGRPRKSGRRSVR